MLVITGGLVHSVASPHGEPRDIVVEGDTIVDIVPRGAVGDANAEVIDASRRLIIPGLINGHTHSHGGLSKGVGDLWELDLLLNAAPWIGGHRSHDDKHLAALITAVEMVEKGATACYDLFFEFPAPTVEGMEAVASAYAKVGLRAVIAPMVADLTFYQAVPGLIDALPDDARDRAAKLRMGGADTVIAALRRLAETWSHPRDRLRLGIAPTIPHHCTREFMIACRDVARSHDLPMQTHVSEAKYQSASTFKVFGMSTVEIMDACGLVGPWLSAAHAIWISDSDMDLLATKGATVSHNAAANLRLGSGDGGGAPLHEPRRHRRHRHRRLGVVRQPEHVRGDPRGGLRVAGARRAARRMDFHRRRLHHGELKDRRACSAWEISSAGSRAATRPISCCSTSITSISCRSTTRPTRSCSPRTAAPSTAC